MTITELTLTEFQHSADWWYIFDHYMSPSPTLGSTVSTEPFDRSDVVEIVALVEGENDGPDWVGVFRLHDGRFASITAGCDYTGWG